MISMNLVFHVFSAVAAFALAWFLVRLRSELKFSREILLGARSGQENVRVYVDSPYRFLKKFADITGIELEDDDFSPVNSHLVKIDGSSLLKMCLEYGVTSIRIKSLANKQLSLGFKGLNMKADRSSAEKLSAAFNGKLQIELDEDQT